LHTFPNFFSSSSVNFLLIETIIGPLGGGVLDLSLVSLFLKALGLGKIVYSLPSTTLSDSCDSSTDGSSTFDY